MTVYRRAVASWYGPGFYGRTTACGLRMTRRLMGVAHRRLPCGTEVAITYKGQAITVPVVDRGPYVRGRRWDLTSAAAATLGLRYTDRLGAVPVG
jgi:rare lipoprotein A